MSFFALQRISLFSHEVVTFPTQTQTEYQYTYQYNMSDEDFELSVSNYKGSIKSTGFIEYIQKTSGWRANINRLTRTLKLIDNNACKSSMIDAMVQK